MPRWEPDARGRLEQAALELFGERGFDRTTVEDIAERAQVTKRTFFRHFPDKREVLFGGAGELSALFVDGLSRLPADAAPLHAVATALDTVGTALAGRRDFGRRRHAVISANTELQERELVKLAAVATAVATVLRERGATEPMATLAAEIAVAVFRVGFDRWVASEDESGLPAALAESLEAARAVLSNDG